jgi:hypothetical protein
VRLVGVLEGVGVWLILCPGCRRDLERISHRQQRVVCLDGVVDLEGRLGNLSHATKVCLDARMAMIFADGGDDVEGQSSC